MDGTKKLIVGIFVSGCLLLFGVGLFLIGNSNQLFTKSFHVYAEFKKITGIQNGGKVRVAGMDAGTVTRIDVPSRPEGKFRIYFKIIEKLHPTRTRRFTPVSSAASLRPKWPWNMYATPPLVSRRWWPRLKKAILFLRSSGPSKICNT